MYCNVAKWLRSMQEGKGVQHARQAAGKVKTTVLFEDVKPDFWLHHNVSSSIAATFSSVATCHDADLRKKVTANSSYVM